MGLLTQNSQSLNLARNSNDTGSCPLGEGRVRVYVTRYDLFLATREAASTYHGTEYQNLTLSIKGKAHPPNHKHEDAKQGSRIYDSILS